MNLSKTSLTYAFVLHGNDLYVLVKDHQFLYHLADYEFDSGQPITRGAAGNHLIKDRIIKKVKTDISSTLTFAERLLAPKHALFITDRPLNNLGIRHYIDFTEQLNASQVRLYHDTPYGNTDMKRFLLSFMQSVDAKEPIGTAGIGKAVYWYKVVDDTAVER